MHPEMLEKIIDIGREMAENLNLEPLLHYAMEVAMDLLGAEFGYLVMVEEDGQLTFRVCRDQSGNRISEPDAQISHTIFDQVITTSEPQVIADAIVDPDYQNAESVLALHLRSVMCVPLISRERVLGAIYLENRTKTSLFDEESLKPLSYLAALAAVSIENVLLYEKLEARVEKRTTELEKANEKLNFLAITDPLTGIYDRRYFFELARNTLKAAERYQHSLSLLMIDIDHFKKVNDAFGHLVGDAVLIEFSHILKENIREVDVVARYGGEEFVIMMPETDLDAAEKSAQRLCRLIDQYEFTHNGDRVHITISVGVSCYDSETGGKELEIDALVDQADKGLYEAKNAGRNGVAAWTPLMGEKG
jgi:diguanylate cyclase (GGDEF)-like protein